MRIPRIKRIVATTIEAAIDVSHEALALNRRSSSTTMKQANGMKIVSRIDGIEITVSRIEVISADCEAISVILFSPYSRFFRMNVASFTLISPLSIESSISFLVSGFCWGAAAERALFTLSSILLIVG